MSKCKQEMCTHWTGQGCACEFLGFDPDDTFDDNIPQQANYNRDAVPIYPHHRGDDDDE